MKKHLLALTLLTIPFLSLAEQCELSDFEGKHFTFSKLTKAKEYATNGKYLTWVYQKNSSNFLNYEQFFSRKAVLSNNYIEEVLPVYNDKSKFKTIRYYPAIVDNCQKVYLKVDTTNLEFDYAFNKRNFRSKKVIDFERHESLFATIFDANYQALRKNIGKTIHLKAQGNNTKLIARKKNSSERIFLEPNTEYTLLDIKDTAFSYQGIERSPYSLIIGNEGNEYEVEANHKIVSLGKLFSNSSIRDEFKQDIINQNIRYGMNRHEVQMAWGIPDLERRQIIYLEKGFGEFVKDDYIEYDEDVFKNKMSNSSLAGIESDWYYFQRLPENNYLVFDKYGLLREYNQVFRLNIEKPPFFLNEIIKK